MACNTCAKPFSFLRQERGCPGCGFSNCSKCLNNKVFLKKLNSEAKVCVRCKKIAESGDISVDPPDAYLKRVSVMDNVNKGQATGLDTPDQQILERLNKLKQNPQGVQTSTMADIENRLQKVKGDIPTATDSELQKRLANIKGVSLSAVQSKGYIYIVPCRTALVDIYVTKGSHGPNITFLASDESPIVLTTDTRSDQEQIDDLLKQYAEQTNIDSNYKEEFDGVINNLELRLQKLKGASTSGTQKVCTPDIDIELEDEETTIKRIIEKAKSETLIENDDLSIKELPFCEICNEDAKMRCRGCKYLFCKDCFNDHKDEDDGCNSYDPYTAPSTS